VKRTTFITLTLILILCLLFVSTVYSKPPVQRTFTRYCCYAKFVDVDASGNPYAIASDGNVFYKDLSIGGTDKVQVETYDDNGELKFLRAYIGKPEIPYRADRRVKLNFDFLNDATLKPGLGTAVYDSLALLPAGGGRRGTNQNNGKYYINDGTAHFYIQLDDGLSRSGILIDKGNLGDPSLQPPPITQATVDAFYNDSNPQYWTPVQASLETGDPNLKYYRIRRESQTDPHDQIVYFLYVNQLSFTVTKDIQGKPCEWTITPPSSGTVNLCVVDSANTHYINLATYPILNFKLLVSKNNSFSAAPPRFDKPTTLWGEIKEK